MQASQMGDQRGFKSEWGCGQRCSFEWKSRLGDKLGLILNWDESYRIYSVHLKSVKEILEKWQTLKPAGGSCNMFFWLQKSLWTENRWKWGLCLICNFVLLSSAVIIGLAPGFSFRAIYSENLLFRIWVHSSLIQWLLSVAQWLNYLIAPAWND